MVSQKKASKKSPKTSDLVFTYGKESSEFLRCSALLRTMTRLTGALAKGNHRVNKALLLFSGLGPTLDSNTWIQQGHHSINIAQTAEDKEFMTDKFPFSVYISKMDSNWSDVVAAALRYSKGEADAMAGALASMQNVDSHV